MCMRRITWSHQQRSNVTTKHPGFHSVATKIAARQGISMKSAGAILAASARRASPAAKRANPRLKKVFG